MDSTSRLKLFSLCCSFTEPLILNNHNYYTILCLKPMGHKDIFQLEAGFSKSTFLNISDL